MSAMTGGRYSQAPSTFGVERTFGGAKGMAAQREVMRETPKTIKQASRYLKAEYRNDLKELYRTSSKLIKAMNAYRRGEFARSTTGKLIGGSAIGYGAYRLGNKLFGNY